MTPPYVPTRLDGPTARRALLRSTLAVGVIDGLFAIALYVVIQKATTVPKLFQGIASVLLHAAAFQGGATTVALGVIMHFAVALGWSVVLLFALERSLGIRRMLLSRAGPLKVALWYGPLVYVVMSLVVTPFLVRRAPIMPNATWLTVLLGHIPFVGLPMAYVLRAAARTARGT